MVAPRGHNVSDFYLACHIPMNRIPFHHVKFKTGFDPETEVKHFYHSICFFLL